MPCLSLEVTAYPLLFGICPLEYSWEWTTLISYAGGGVFIFLQMRSLCRKVNDFALLNIVNT
jgi:hypothetical protein